MESQTRILSGRYELAHLVARGGMAEVYRAHDRLLDRPVALKVLFPELSVDRSFVERFRREAQAAANLSHPNIVPVFDWGEDASTYFIVMEYVDGRALSSILRTAGPLHPDRAAEIGADVAAALAYAHRHGVVHRDVKPGNVLITDEGMVKVTDFGIARAVNTEESLTQTGAVMGTATYFSPEQAEGMGVDARSDIYSLGVVLFELVTGRPPFLGESPVAVASKHVREHPPTPREINPSVPPDLEAVILKCLAKDPEYRYDTGDELRSDLLRFREGRAVFAELPVSAFNAGITGTQVLGAVGATQAIPAYNPNGGEYDPEEELPSRTGLYVALLLVLLAALGVVVFFLGKSLHWWDTPASAVTLQDLSGQSVTQAENTLHSEGLAFRVQAEPSATTTPTTQVVSTMPAAGTKVTKGSTVTIVTGAQNAATLPAALTIPDERGQSVQAAKTILLSKGFQVVVQSSATCTQQNIVCDQNPEPGGQPVAPGATVTLYTASTTVSVPDVSGKSVTAACNLLNQAGLQCGQTSSQPSNAIASGNVIATNPAAGSQEPTNTSINIVESSGPSQVTVPDVVSETQAQAVSDLQGAGLAPVVSCSAVDTPPPNGASTDVISENPSPGSSKAPGATVTLSVQAYQSCSSPSTPTTTSTSPTTSTTSPQGQGQGPGYRPRGGVSH